LLIDLHLAISTTRLNAWISVAAWMQKVIIHLALIICDNSLRLYMQDRYIVIGWVLFLRTPQRARQESPNAILLIGGLIGGQTKWTPWCFSSLDYRLQQQHKA
jgi:hypothetical protein